MSRYPKTRKQWWDLLDNHWVDLQNILWRFLPMSGFEVINTRGNGPATVLSSTRMAVVVQDMRDGKDPFIARYLNAAWATAPDDPSIHSIPGWDVLCDLCSEEYLLYDEGEEGEECDE